ncbi:MAG: Mov34/MPN/PAD-1 family protein [Bryobacteraceae bacterium]
MARWRTMEMSKDALIGWGVADCPFRIEYAPQVLDDIRLAVVDAFFSLPRGGAEIGGILLGRHRDGVVAITGHRPLECEHVFGPSFQLSPRDESNLRELVAAAAGDDEQVVGWYHSHTRSGIFLSEEDLAIYQRHFPESWQVALVLKPHSYDPTRAGFFFRDASGAIRAESSAAEFALEARPVRPLLPGNSAPEAAGYSTGMIVGAAQAPMAPPANDRPALTDAAGEVAVTEFSQTGGAFGVPSFLETEPEERRSWRWLRLVLSVAAGMAIGVVAFDTRQVWLPRLGASRPAATRPSLFPALGLNLLDNRGQLQIRWNAGAPAIANATGAVLDIVDGSAVPHSVTLDPAHLESGSFTYARESGEVDVALTIDRTGAAPLKEASSFWGRPPAGAGADAEGTELRQQRDDLAVEAARLEADLKAEIERNRRLERSLADVRGQLKTQQRKRVETQNSGR